jgi:hypothetical protein
MMQVRQLNDVDLDSLKYKKFDGRQVLKPSGTFFNKHFNKETGEENVPSNA